MVDGAARSIRFRYAPLAASAAGWVCANLSYLVKFLGVAANGSYSAGMGSKRSKIDHKHEASEIVGMHRAAKTGW